ncbi:transposase [[Eubacterium] hominis]|uniref:transposase n=1 Tax=[Eubacterium] hominis TaxID=2764325 RepID=UPI003A4D5B18
MPNYSKKVISSFKKIVRDLAAQKSSLNLVANASVDFTRNRKLPLSDMLLLIVFMSAKPIKEELFDYFDFSLATASSSAFVQARDKILPDAFESLFHNVNDAFSYSKTYHDYRLIAVDGSDLPISYDPKDTETLQGLSDEHNGHNQYHINAAFDILNNCYTDAIVNSATHSAEQESMWRMVERYKGSKAIFIADRSYATWNNMEHIKHAGQFFLIRAKDISSNGLLKKFKLPDGEFDVDIDTILTTRQTNEVKENPDTYRFLSSSSTFDFIDKDTSFYTVNYRLCVLKSMVKKNMNRSFLTYLESCLLLI